ncbi:transglutaminase-like domain-containing protein [Altererythrobacter sp. MF3-039]
MTSKCRTVKGVISELTQEHGSDKALAIAIHDFVRDEIAFGFTPYFDAASPATTLKLKVGHCNPQARLVVALFREAGFEARFQPVTISDEVLRGAVSAVPRLSHVFAEVRVDGKWVRLDSYIADPALRTAAVERLECEQRVLGYGCHVSATGKWDGKSDSFSQVATPDLIEELHEPVSEIEDFYRSDKYLHRGGPLTFDTMFALGRPLPDLFMTVMNRRLNALRESRPGQLSSQISR